MIFILNVEQNLFPERFISKGRRERFCSSSTKTNWIFSETNHYGCFAVLKMFTSLVGSKEYPHNDQKPCEQTTMEYYEVRINSVDKSNVCLSMALQLVLNGTPAASCHMRMQREQVAPACKGLCRCTLGLHRSH